MRNNKGNSFAKIVEKRLILNRVASLSKNQAMKNSVDYSETTNEDDTLKENRKVTETPEDQLTMLDEDSFSQSKSNNFKKQTTHEHSTFSLENTLTESNQETSNALNQHNHPTQQDTNRDSLTNTVSNFDFCLPKDIVTMPMQSSIDKTVNNLGTLSPKNKKPEVARKPGIPKPRAASKKKKEANDLKLTDHELELLKIGDDADMERIFNRTTGKAERKNSVSLKALSGPIHAVWSQNVIDYQKTLPSVKKRQNLEEIRNQFENVTDEKIIDIHKRLEMFLKKRIQNCLVKYQAMNPNERGLHKMLDAMKDNVIAYQRFEDSKNAAAQMVYYPWYLDLEVLIDASYGKDDVILSKLIEKLSYHGKLNTRKKNEALFFRVLDNLKIWELLSPDIMSAIEFCRNRILEINEDDFEDWFRSKTVKNPELFVSRKKDDINKLEPNNKSNEQL